MGHRVLSLVSLVFAYSVSFGLPFYYHRRISCQLGDNDDAREAGLKEAVDYEVLFVRFVEGWKTIRLSASFLCIGVGIPAFSSYNQVRPRTLPDLLFILSVIFSATSFASSTMLIFCFMDWSKDVKWLEDKRWAWCATFAAPIVFIIWSMASLLGGGVTFAVQVVTIQPAFPNDNSQIMFVIVLVILGIIVTWLFYMTTLLLRS